MKFRFINPMQFSRMTAKWFQILRVKSLILFFIVFIPFTSFSFGGNDHLDSLWKTYNDRTLHDSIRHWALADLAWEYCYINPDSARIFSRMQLRYQKKSNGGNKLKTDAINTIGNSFMVQGNYDSALVYFFRNEKIQKSFKLKTGLIATYTNIADVYRNQAKYHLAFQYANKALKTADEMGKKEVDKARLYNNIGAIHYENEDYTLALEQYAKAAELFKVDNSERELANVYNNMGMTYSDVKNFKKAFHFAFRSLHLRKKMGDSIQIANSFQQIAGIHHDFGSADSAFYYANLSIEMNRRTNSIDGLAGSLAAGGNYALVIGKSDIALKWCDEAYSISTEHDIPSYLKNACDCLYGAYKKKGNDALALKYFEEGENIEETNDDKENMRRITKLSMQYKHDREMMEDSLQNAQMKKVQDAEISAQKAQLKQEETLRYSLYGGLFLVVLFGIFMYNRFTVTRRQKIIIETQKHEVEQQKELVEEKNKEILDSINYAKRLQEAILPPMKLIKEYLNDSFILYKPKDIVAGDFYFMEPVKNKIIFAAADCTGHGVPGAMVSVVCANAMNRAVKEFSISDPGKILDKVRELILETFEKSESEVKDGMDISLCVLDFDTKIIHWSGANNPIWIVRNGENVIEEIKPDKQPVGKTSDPKPFKTHEIKLYGGDRLYLFTDGFEDQFGGEKGKKFKSSKMKELFLSIRNENMEVQRSLIYDSFEKWKGDLEQVDDVCIIGIRI